MLVHAVGHHLRVVGHRPDGVLRDHGRGFRRAQPRQVLDAQPLPVAVLAGAGHQGTGVVHGTLRHWNALRAGRTSSTTADRIARSSTTSSKRRQAV